MSSGKRRPFGFGLNVLMREKFVVLYDFLYFFHVNFLVKWWKIYSQSEGELLSKLLFVAVNAYVIYHTSVFDMWQ